MDLKFSFWTARGRLLNFSSENEPKRPFWAKSWPGANVLRSADMEQLGVSPDPRARVRSATRQNSVNSGGSRCLLAYGKCAFDTLAMEKKRFSKMFLKHKFRSLWKACRNFRMFQKLLEASGKHMVDCNKIQSIATAVGACHSRRAGSRLRARMAGAF